MYEIRKDFFFSKKEDKRDRETWRQREQGVERERERHRDRNNERWRQTRIGGKRGEEREKRVNKDGESNWDLSP